MVRSVNVSNGQVTIDTSSACFGVPRPINLTANVGSLPAGNYSVLFTESTGGCVSVSNLPLSFVVVAAAPEPIPTLHLSALLLLSLLVGAVLWANRRLGPS